MKSWFGHNLALATLLAGCSGSSSQPLDAGAAATRIVHTDLLELAATVRRGGGIVLAGSTTAVAPTSSHIVPAMNGLSVEYEQVFGELSVSDSLGSAASTSLRVVGPTGVVRWVNVNHTPADGGEYGAPGSVLPSQRMQATASGVYFLYPRPSDGGALWFMYWRASIDPSGRVSGEGTRSEQNVDLAALRLDAGR
jgi:hypothetical protein